jgi:hypothetical protein
MEVAMATPQTPDALTTSLLTSGVAGGRGFPAIMLAAGAVREDYSALLSMNGPAAGQSTSVASSSGRRSSPAGCGSRSWRSAPCVTRRNPTSVMPAPLQACIEKETDMNTLRIAAAGLAVFLVCSPTIARADVVLDWNEIMVAVVADQPPTLMNRLAAITHLAVFDAVNAVTGEYRPYLTTVNPSPGASADAAAIAAAHGVLKHYAPTGAAMLDAARARSLSRIADGPAKAAGVSIGEAVAADMIAARENDGSEPPEFYVPTSSNPGEWQRTADCPPAGGLFLHWRNVKPFVLRRADQFRSDPPPALASNRYARDYKEVKDIGGRDSTRRRQDRTNVVLMYAAVGDAVLWNPIAQQLAAARRTSLSQNARTFALLNMALSDAAVAVLETKYHYNFWRPETAIPAAGGDGNEKTDPVSSYVPFISTPCFPSYPSGHATSSYAAREVLERVFGRRGHSIVVSSPALPDVILKYTTLREITSDIDDARVYGGIHFRFDQEGGAEQGRHVGAYVYRHTLRRGRGCTCDEEEK